MDFSWGKRRNRTASDDTNLSNKSSHSPFSSLSCRKDTAKSTRSLNSKSSSTQLISALKVRNDTPAVGTEREVEESKLSAYPILPPYVLLFEPKEEQIWSKPGQQRLIFLNQPLLQWEQDAIEKFVALLRKELGLREGEALPRFLLPHLTRLLQQCKYRPENAVKLWRALLVERVDLLPLDFWDVQEILSHGLVYWHGRDMNCRPLLTIRIGRVAPLLSRTEDIQRLFIFTMEYAVRYLLVPGRVECWSVIIDCEGVSKLPSWLKCKTFAQTLATTLGKVYSGRMAWTKIFNFPSGWSFTALRKLVQGIVSALGKSDKVQFVKEGDMDSLAGHVEKGQLEKWAGGLAPDMDEKDVFPPRMFADPKGYGASSESVESMHRRTDVAFHEGLIWAECLQEQTNWKERAADLPLPPKAADKLGVKPCQQIEAWKAIMDMRRAKEPLDSEDTPKEFSVKLAEEAAKAREAAKELEAAKSATEADTVKDGNGQNPANEKRCDQISIPIVLTPMEELEKPVKGIVEMGSPIRERSDEDEVDHRVANDKLAKPGMFGFLCCSG